jgi:hypothetical protein
MEMKAAVKTLKQNGAVIVAVSGNRHSWIVRECQEFLFAGVECEGSPFALECPSPQSGAGDEQKRVERAPSPSQRGSRGRKILTPLEVSREGRTRIGVIPKPARGVWSQESVMMTVVTSLETGLIPFRSLLNR